MFAVTAMKRWARTSHEFFDKFHFQFNFFLIDLFYSLYFTNLQIRNHLIIVQNNFLFWLFLLKNKKSDILFYNTAKKHLDVQS